MFTKLCNIQKRIMAFAMFFVMTAAVFAAMGVSPEAIAESDYSLELETLPISAGSAVFNIYFDSNKNLFLHTQKGLYKSTGEIDWKFQEYADDTGYFIDIITHKGELFAQKRIAPYKNDLYKSENDGKTWVLMDTPFDNISKIYSKDDVLIVESYEYFHYSNNSGKTWNTIKLYVRKDPNYFGGEVDFYTQEEDYIYSSRYVLFYNGSLYACYSAINFKGILVYNNNSEKWERFNCGINEQSIFNLHEIENIVYASTINGLFASSDGMKTWEPVNEGLPERSIISCMVKYKGIFYAGTWEHGVYYSEDAKTWFEAKDSYTLGRVNFIKFNNMNLFIGTQYGLFGISRHPPDIDAMREFGGALVPFNSGINESKVKTVFSNDTRLYAVVNKSYTYDYFYDFIWDYPMAKTFYNDCLYVSSDNGKTWIQYVPDQKFGNINSITGNDKQLFMCTDNGEFGSEKNSDLYISINNGMEWEKVKNNNPENHYTSIVLKDDILYASFEHYDEENYKYSYSMMESNDCGKTWTNKTYNRGELYVDNGEILNKNGNDIYKYNSYLIYNDSNLIGYCGGIGITYSNSIGLQFKTPQKNYNIGFIYTVNYYNPFRPTQALQFADYLYISTDNGLYRLRFKDPPEDPEVFTDDDYKGIISVAKIPGAEYKIEGVCDWQEDTVFYNLAACSTYTILTRYKGSETSLPSLPSNGITVTTGKLSQKSNAVAPRLKSPPEETRIILQSFGNYEYSKNGGITWQSHTIFANLKPNTEYIFVSRIKENDTTFASVISEPVTIKTDKLTPQTPEKPQIAGEIGDTCFKLNPVVNCEYSIDGGITWQDDSQFEGLNPETDYTVIVRIKATEDSYASPSSEELVITTASKAIPPAINKNVLIISIIIAAVLIIGGTAYAVKTKK